jgi:hypothetical protein
MSWFSRAPGGEGRDSGDPSRYIARFTTEEAAALRDLTSQVAELVSGTAERGRPAETEGGAPPAPGAPGDTGAPGAPGAFDEIGAFDVEEELGLTSETGPPDDPALARLLPDAYREDPQAAGEFRRYTERDLRDGKAAAARTILETLPEHGGRVTLSEDQAQTWLRALNDIRLALGVRLGVTEEVHEELAQMDPADPRYGPLTIYDWLTEVQESLVVALS